MHRLRHSLPYVALILQLFSATVSAESASPPPQASRHHGGLFVWVGKTGTDWQTWASSANNAPRLVQVLLADASAAGEGQRWVAAHGLLGRVTVEAWDHAELPYADGLVTCLHLAPGTGISLAEARRVLRSFGELTMEDSGQIKIETKSRQAGTDDWTHWRHGPDRNPVSHDQVVSVPERIQWLLPGSVMSERCHLVTANGRIFSQDRELLTARDATTGLPLWQTKLKKGKEFEWEWTVKVSALIIAVGERVFALTEDGNYKSLDAATGRVLRVFTEAISPYDALVVEHPATEPTLITAADSAIRAFGAESGKLLWQETSQHPGTLIASQDTLFYIEGNDKRGADSGTILARDLATGQLRWSQRYDWARRTEQGAFGHEFLVYEMRNPVDWRERYEKDPKQKDEDRFALAVISAKTGELVRKITGTGTSARHGEFRAAFWHSDHLVTEAVLKDGINVVQFGLTDFSKPLRAFRANDVGDRGFGHCYPPVLTDRYYLNGQLNFVDMATGSPLSNPITRGGCNTARSGYVPANGLIYTFPKHCICYPMLDGNVALAPRDTGRPPEENAFVQGPAWPAALTNNPSLAEWPTFRADAWRSGGVPTKISELVELKWSTQVGKTDSSSPMAAEWSANPFLAGPISAPTAAAGLVFVAQSDAHRIVALDASTGVEKWQFVTGGRVDLPPTIYRGLCLTGSRDGWIYALRVSDGALIWKLRAAPIDRRIVVHGQVESPWGVVGSIMITDDLGYAVAGLHPNSDGGILVIAFDPASGSISWQSKFDDLGFDTPWPAPYDPRTTRPESNPWRTIRPLEYPYYGLPVRDGDGVAVSRCVFDLKTGRAELKKTKGYIHNKSTGVWLPRTSWRYATERDGSPTAVSLGSSVFGSAPAASRLFRVNFTATTVFDDDWVHAEDPKQEVAKEAFSLNKIHALGPAWEAPSQDNRRAFNRAMLVTEGRLFTVTPRGNLTIHDTTDGRMLREIKLEMPVWNGLAAVNGDLIVTTMSGRVLCYGLKH